MFVDQQRPELSQASYVLLRVDRNAKRFAFADVSKSGSRPLLRVTFVVTVYTTGFVVSSAE